MTVKFVINFFKYRLIFYIFYYFWMFVNDFSHTYTLRISENVKDVLMWNLQHIVFILRRRYWQIFKPALVYLQLLCYQRVIFVVIRFIPPPPASGFMFYYTLFTFSLLLGMLVIWNRLDGQKIQVCVTSFIEFSLILLWPRTLDEENVVKAWGNFC